MDDVVAAVDAMFVAGEIQRTENAFEELGEMTREKREACLRLTGCGYGEALYTKWGRVEGRSALFALMNGLLRAADRGGENV
jgi:hypothetical protein